ncbi:MAG: hypothetical protein JNL60_11315 [Bacteroidia bacterium]|nr:hypothetical protein [Bacteroidia bacterium]
MLNTKLVGEILEVLYNDNTGQPVLLNPMLQNGGYSSHDILVTMQYMNDQGMIGGSLHRQLGTNNPNTRKRYTLEEVQIKTNISPKGRKEYMDYYMPRQIESVTTINAIGHGNIINTGKNGKIDANIHISIGDKTALTERLLSSGVEKTDIDELLAIIDTEKPDGDSFGSKTGKWIKKMLGKAIDGSWQVGIGAAGTLLAEAIKAYHG